MIRVKLAKYSVLSLFSACLFFATFHAVAEAQTPIYPPPPAIADAASSEPIIIITPTLFPTSTPALQAPTPTIGYSEKSKSPPIIVATDLETLFSKYSEDYHVDHELMKKIARCESGFNPLADTGYYVGMFQFAPQTWISTRTRMGLDPNIDLRKNAEESIRTAAFMISNGGQNAWKNCL